MNLSHGKAALAWMAAAILLNACSGNSGSLPATALLQSISVTSSNASIPTDGAQQFTAIATYGGGTTVDITSSAIWSSSSPTIAAVNTSGIATGLAAGTATITATLGSVSGSIPLTVTSAVLQSIAASPSNINLASGQTQQLTATGTYSDGSSADITSLVTWTADTPLIASVNASGLATGMTGGISTFTASIGIISASTVSALSVEMESNNTSAAATVLSPGVTMTGQLMSNSDSDYYKVTPTGSGAISVSFITANANIFNAGWSVSILDSAGAILSSVNHSGVADTQIINAGVSVAGTYYVLAQPPAGATAANNSTENYTLNATVP